MGKKLGGNVQIQIGNHTYDVVIEKKRGVKNTYLRVKKDLKLYVSTSILVSDRKIKQTIEENMPAIVKMYEKQLRKQEENSGFSFLGKNMNRLSLVAVIFLWERKKYLLVVK